MIGAWRSFRHSGPVIPAKAGIQAEPGFECGISLDSRFRGNDGNESSRKPSARRVRRSIRNAIFALAAILAAAVAGPAIAAAKSASSSAILPGSNSKEPISIDADKLVYYDKEQKAIYSGNVVAIQGESKLTCSALTIFLTRNEAPAATSAAPKGAAAPGGEGPSASSQVKRMEASGPVTVVSKTQVATGDRGVYDKTENKVWLFGNVTLSDGGNVTKGDKLTYDLTTGQAVVETGHSTQRVHGLFIPNGDESAEKSAPGKKKAP